MNRSQRGLANHNAKLSAADIRQMRDYNARFKLSYRALGRMFKVNWTTARAIVRLWTYRDI